MISEQNKIKQKIKNNWITKKNWLMMKIFKEKMEIRFMIKNMKQMDFTIRMMIILNKIQNN